MTAAPVVYGKYQLLERLAVGGMAEVFKAKAHGVEGFEKILVIKRILPELGKNPRFVEMFIAEAKIAVTLSHANIVQVFDLGRADDSYFIAMEYVAGRDLSSVLRRGRQRRKPLSQELAVFVVSEIAKGLDYAHRRRDQNMRPLGIVHRDVSPQNVLLSLEGEVKLTDFGIAKARTIASDGDPGELRGKYAYMPPEQANAGQVDPRSDLYALGVVLYEALSGQNPFDHESAYETLRRVRDPHPTPLRHVNPDVPEELAAIVDRAMRANPDERHANAGRLYEELVQFLYSSGRRVGGHDLSRYLLEQRESSAEGSSDQDARLLAVFESDDGAQKDDARGRTPVESPRSRRPAKRTPSRPITAAARSTVERRDVSALVILDIDRAFFADPSVARVVDRLGAFRAPDDGTGPEGREVLLFGVRDPDGRDTEVAARCGLRLARLAAMHGRVPRLGLDVGRLLVDLSGAPILDNGFAELSQRADQCAQQAAPGQMLATPTAARIVSSSFTTLPTGELGAPYLIENETAGQAAGKFVGRREELKVMGELLALANRGRSKIVGITGDAGLGKTRLVGETRRRLRLGGHDVGFYVATCVSKDRSTPYAAAQEMLRAILGLDALDEDAVVHDRVQRLRELGLAPHEISAMAALLGAVEGDRNESLGSLVRPAITRIVSRLAADRLTVLVFDAAESMDDESQALLDGIAKDLKSSRVAVVIVFRPGFVHGWSDLSAYHEIVLGPMSDDDVARATAMLLSVEEVPGELLREVTQKCAGNPLFLEELVKALVDAGAVELTDGRTIYRPEIAVEVPKTLRGLASARLARLGPVDRHLLQIAAVVGGRISPELLAAVGDETLESVMSSLSMLERRGLLSRSGSDDLVFAHELVGDVLRDGLTLEARREMHRAIAEALESLFPQRHDELAERLANHWREAGERNRAIDYWVRAGDRYAMEQAASPAAQAYAKAVQMLGQAAVPDRDRMLALYLRIGEVCWKARRAEGDQHMLAAIELAEALERRDYLARFALLHGRFLVAAYRVEEARQWLERAQDLARVLDDRALFRDVLLGTAESIVRVGQHRTAIQYLQQAFQLSREDDDVEMQLRCLTNLALTQATGGDPKSALQTVERARSLLSQRPDRLTECELFKMESLVHYFGRSYERAIEAARRGLELAKEHGFPYEAAVDAHNMGDCYVRLGDYKAAFASLRYSYEISRDNGIEYLQDANLRMLGFIDAMRFGSEDGRLHVLESMRKAERRGHVWDIVQTRFLLAMIQQQSGDPENARTSLREALRIGSENGFASYVSACEVALAALDSGQPIPLVT